MEPSHDFDPPADNWLARAYYTPVSDALRGQLSARLDVRREIAAAKLPPAIPGFIYTVVRRTRLWRREKIDVARELSAHFADGLAAGRSREQLIADFGDATTAARLIRQAKRRTRPLVWQAWWYASWSLAVLVIAGMLGYALLAARFFLASPSIAHNYWDEINAARSSPVDRQAWPLYREAVLKLGKDDYELLGKSDVTQPELSDVVERHSDVVDLVRRGAAKPELSYLIGAPDDRQVAAKASADWLFRDDAPLSRENKELISAELPGIQAMRKLARLLEVGAWRAAAAGGGAAVLADLSALVAMSEQFFQRRAFTVEQLVGFAVFNRAMETTRRILADHPAVLDDAQLRDLAHRIAAFHGGQMPVDLAAERMAFDDVLQRAYTDDGAGDGRLAAGSIELLRMLVGFSPNSDRPDDWEVLLGPVVSLVGGRRENRELLNTYFDEAIAAHQGPAWTWDREAIDAANDRFGQALATPAGRMRFIFAGLFAPAVERLFNAAEIAQQQRDATEVAIALVLWHRRHGSWPERLDQLVPDLLPAVPSDRMTGRPLRYAVQDDRPLVYSVGADGDDDGGRPTDPPTLASTGFRGLQMAGIDRQSAADGDWLLWPVPAERDSEAEAAAGDGS